MYAHYEELRPTFGRWANDLAVIAAGFVPAVFAVAALALSVGGPSAVRDSWIGGLGTVALGGAFAMAALAFVFALASKIRHEPSDSLWFPLGLLPVVAVVAVLIKAIWVA